MSEWQACTLSDVLKFGNGKSRPKEFGEIPVYGGNGILDYTNCSNYSEETIVIGRVGAYCGATYYENNEIWVSDNALSAKALNGNDAKFLYYFLKNLDLNQFAQGSSHPLLTQTLLNSIEVIVPSSCSEQKAIASVLSSLDDKIDLLHRQNKTLEAMAETLFRQWFIEEAKEDWEEKTIGDIFTIKGGGTPSTKEPSYWDGSIAWTSPRDLSTAKSLYMFSTERTITELGLTKVSSGLLPVGTLLMSSRAPIGYLALTDIEVAVNQGYIAILKHDLYSNEFMYLWCKANMELIKNSGNGSVFQEISKASFRELPFVCPPEPLLKRFNGYCINWFSKIKLNAKQIQTLENLRDTLLPRLMSGEVRVQYQTEDVA
ncbi:TPA: restriction endonuclease subunit S [Acinetobacter baumannii]|nr:restriction endonuclease subunit S [Acinetobacter baumannii]